MGLGYARRRIAVIALAVAALVVLPIIDARQAAAEPNWADPTSLERRLANTERWMFLIMPVAQETGVPWQVLRAVMTAESGGRVIAYQPTTGGTGLMGVVPRLWQHVANEYGGDLLNPETNMRTAAFALANAYLAHPDWTQAAATYGGALDANGAFTGRGQAYLDELNAVFATLTFDPATAGGPTIDAAAPTLQGNSVAADALGWAMTTMGTPYVWGGESYREGGFDCSGLVLWSYTQVGKSLPRVAVDQWAFVEHIDAADVRPGDLVFFRDTLGPNTGITHVGFYAGAGRMLHAPKENDAVRIVSLNTTYWRSHLVGYGRVP